MLYIYKFFFYGYDVNLKFFCKIKNTIGTFFNRSYYCYNTCTGSS